ncbi:MAG: chloride channel protein [Verrucomicrobia bacterium]|nr:chloride channel protein [Verrucomicrobiota bacterium]
MGVVAGLGAIAFYAGCHVVVHYALDAGAGYRPEHPGGEPPLLAETQQPFRAWTLLLIPTVGGILTGLLVYTLAPEAEGHGTDAAIAAFHHRQGSIRPRVPLVKLIASALTIGTGGSGGREGPIAQIGAGFGSFVGNLFRLRPADCRVLMAAGMGAGVAAIFRAPLAGALFAAEVLYRSSDIETSVIVPAALASTTAYCTFALVFGWTPLFTLPPEVADAMSFRDPRQLLAYLLLALFLVILAMLYTRAFYGITGAFRRLRLPRHVKPAVGALATGLAGLGAFYLLGKDERVLAVLSFGYGTLQNAMTTTAQGRPDLFFALILLVVALGKSITTGLTIGSGGSGGVFGPSMVIGGCGGGALGILLHSLWPTLVPCPSSFVIVGMAGFFAAAAKTPLSTLVIVSEMTGNYSLLLPTLWVCVLTFLLSDEQSIYSSQVESRSLSPAHQGDYIREVLAGLHVRGFLGSQQDVPTLRASDRLPDVVARLTEASYHGLPVTDEHGRYCGMVSLEEVLLASRFPSVGSAIIAADLMRSDIPPLRPDDRLDRALELFSQTDRLALAVVDGSPDHRVIGIVRRADISSAYLQRVYGSDSSEG